MKKPTLVLVVLFSLPLAPSLTTPQGLSCVNDFVNNVSCTWRDFGGDHAQDCWISSQIGKRKTMPVNNASCKLSRNTPAGCSLVFENYIFNPLENLPQIILKCNGTLVKRIENYLIRNHIKMNPPGAPDVNKTGNQTLISWSPGHPCSTFIDKFEFEVELRQNREKRVLPGTKPWLRLDHLQLKGKCQVRVRVKTNKYGNSTWSDWSPTKSWICSESPELTQAVILAVTVMSGSLFFLLLSLSWVLHRICKRSLKIKPVPNPSKYFQTLHSVHSGNLKKWLNPQSTPASFFITQHHDNISPVEVCENWPVSHPPTSPSASSTATLPSRSYVMTSSDTSGVVDSSSSSSSFSNMGYFLSSYGSGKTASRVNFKRDFQHLQSNPAFPVRVSQTRNSQNKGCLKREVQSPDSGFSLGSDDDDRSTREMLVAGHNSSSPTAHAPLQVLFHSSTGEAQMLSDCQELEQPAETSNVAWPVSYRSTSMPVESSNAGYFTLKDIQATFRNNSL